MVKPLMVLWMKDENDCDNDLALSNLIYQKCLLISDMSELFNSTFNDDICFNTF